MVGAVRALWRSSDERSRLSCRNDMSFLFSRSVKADLKSRSGAGAAESDLSLPSSDFLLSDPDRRLSVTGWSPPYPVSE